MIMMMGDNHDDDDDDDDKLKHSEMTVLRQRSQDLNTVFLNYWW